MKLFISQVVLIITFLSINLESMQKTSNVEQLNTDMAKIALEPSLQKANQNVIAMPDSSKNPSDQNLTIKKFHVESLKNLAEKKAPKDEELIKKLLKEHTQRTKLEEKLKIPTEWPFSSTGKTTPEELRSPSFSEIFIKLTDLEGYNITLNLYQFNLYPIAYALCKASEAGVTVEIILNSAGTTQRGTAQLLLKRCDINIKYLSPSPDQTELGGSFKHAKTATFGENSGRAYLSKIKNYTDFNEEELKKTSQLFWIGSFNFTGNSEKKCYEDVLISSVEKSTKYYMQKFDQLSKDAEKETNKTEYMLEALEDTESKKTDFEINGVPSQNVLYLLQSKFWRPKNTYSYLTKDEILNYKDFVPEIMKQKSYLKENTDFMDTYTNMKQIIPNKINLPYPCYLILQNASLLLITLSHQTVTLSEALTKNIPLFPITDNENETFLLWNSVFYDQSNEKIEPNLLDYQEFTPLNQKKINKHRIIPEGIELPFACHLHINNNETKAFTKNGQWILLEKERIRKNSRTNKYEYTSQTPLLIRIINLGEIGAVQANLDWLFKEKNTNKPYSLAQIQELPDDFKTTFKGPYSTIKENGQGSFASIENLNKKKLYKASDLKIKNHQIFNHDDSSLWFALEELLSPTQTQLKHN